MRKYLKLILFSETATFYFARVYFSMFSRSTIIPELVSSSFDMNNLIFDEK